jgi:hypothetical protein
MKMGGERRAEDRERQEERGGLGTGEDWRKRYRKTRDRG